MSYLVCHLLMLVLVIGSYTATALPGEGRAGELVIRKDQDTLTIKAREVPHRRILEELASQLAFELIIAGALEERRSLDIESRPWEEVLKKALSPASWAFVYDSSAGVPRLAKVFVFTSKADGSTPVRSPSPQRRIDSPSPAPLSPASTPTPEPQVESEPTLADKGIDASLAELLEAEDEEMRALALVSLATMGGEQAITALRQALQDKEPWIRETAVEALAEIGGEGAIQGLQQALRDSNEDVRRAAQEALTRLQRNPQ
jgi:predicted component of type VI protein secretion system